jgi:hypothetical protein
MTDPAPERDDDPGRDTASPLPYYSTGLYAPHFTEDEKRALAQMTDEQLHFEIALLRVVTARYLGASEELPEGAVEQRAKLWAGLYGGIAKIIAAARACQAAPGEDEEDPLDRVMRALREHAGDDP